MTSLTVPIFVPLGSPLASSSADGAAAALVSNGTSIAGAAPVGAGAGVACGVAAVGACANAAKLHASNIAATIHRPRVLRFQNFISYLLAIASLSSIARPPDGLRSEFRESRPG